jgi:hypothetical protein
LSIQAQQVLLLKAFSFTFLLKAIEGFKEKTLERTRKTLYQLNFLNPESTV